MLLLSSDPVGVKEAMTGRLRTSWSGWRKRKRGAIVSGSQRSVVLRIRFPQPLAEILAPALRQRFRLGGAAKKRLIISIASVEICHVGHRQTDVVTLGERDQISGPNLTFAQNG